MNELELKYGCNPNQKPSRIFMRDGSNLPVTVLSGTPGYINFLDALNSWQLVHGGSFRGCVTSSVLRHPRAQCAPRNCA